MDSDKLNAFSQLDPRILRMLQWATLVFSILPVVALFLVHDKFLPAYSYHDWAFYVIVTGLPIMGFLQLLWAPFTEHKARFYIVVYHALAIIDFMFVVSYDSIYIFAWLLLILVTDAYLGRRAALLSMASFLGSMGLWWWLNSDVVPESGLVTILLFILAVFICIIALVVSRIRVISEERGVDLITSREKERLERERLVALINSMSDAVIGVNETGEISVYNAAASGIFDTHANLIGKQISDMLHLLDEKGQQVDLVQLLSGMKGRSNLVRTDLRHQFADKEIINIYLSVSPIYLGFQKPGEQGYIFLLRDITKEKSLEQERDEFISVASHELRTPIAIAEGSLSNVIALKKRNADPKIIDKSIDDAHDQVVLLAKMANDLATLSRAERGVKGLEAEDVDLHALLTKLEADFAAHAKEKGLTLIVRSKETLGNFTSSQVYLQEILQNLINNSIKYTKTGSVVVSSDIDSMGRAVFTVEDTGIGMSKSDQKHLFEKFWRSEDYRTRESSGTGLGLYLVQKLTQQLGGQVKVESQLNEGSTFTVVIPPLTRKVDHAQQQAEVASTLPKP